MKFKTLSFVLLSIFLFPVFSLEIHIVEDEVTFNESGDPIEINLMLLNNGKVIQWNTEQAIKISSFIRVVDIHDHSLGYRDDSDITFIPMGVSNDKRLYKLVGVINRNIETSQKIEALVKILGKKITSDSFIVNIPEKPSLGKVNHLDQKAFLNESNYLTTDKFNSKINEFYIAVLLTITGTILALYLTQKKTNQVAEEQGSKLDSRINTTYEKSTKKHHKILNTTKKIRTDTKELKKLSDRIDQNIENLSKNPEKYKKQLKSNLLKYESLLQVTRSDIEERDSDLFQVQNQIIDFLYSNSIKIEALSNNAEVINQKVVNVEKHVVENYNILSNLVPVNNENIRKIIVDEFGSLSKNY